MKKLLFLFLVLGMVSCKDGASEPKVEVTYKLQVDYLDGVRDTLELKTDDMSYEPRLSSTTDISTIELGWETKAAYVKTFKVLSKEYVELK